MPVAKTSMATTPKTTMKRKRLGIRPGSFPAVLCVCL
jgi:hypothetical protein